MSTPPAPEPFLQPRPSASSGGPRVAVYRVAVLLVLCVNAWYLHGIKEATRELSTGRDLKTFWSFSKDRLTEQTKVVPVYVINGIDVQRIEGHGGNASYVAPLKVNIDSPLGVPVQIQPSPFTLPVKIQDQPPVNVRVNK
jgi:hypothetical protein